MTYDLSQHPPRRWSETVDGIVWLPRFIDKANAYVAGTLGPYVYGKSPADASFLHAAKLDYARFLTCVRGAADDRAVLANIEAAAPGATERLRAWTANPAPIVRFTFGVVDADEGYMKGVPALRNIVPKPVIGALIGLWRRAQPLKIDSTA